MSIFGGLVMQMVAGNAGGAGRLLENAGRSALRLGAFNSLMNLQGLSASVTGGASRAPSRFMNKLRAQADDAINLDDSGRSAIISALGGGSLGRGADELIDMLVGSTALGSTFLGEQEEPTTVREAVKEKIVTAAQKRKQKRQHEQWLEENRWRFDWRSQPRHPAGAPASQGGEWMEGRLDHPVVVKYALSRRERQRRTRAIRAYKQRMADLGHTKTRTIRTAWGDY